MHVPALVTQVLCGINSDAGIRGTCGPPSYVTRGFRCLVSLHVSLRGRSALADGATQLKEVGARAYGERRRSPRGDPQRRSPGPPMCIRGSLIDPQRIGGVLAQKGCDAHSPRGYLLRPGKASRLPWASQPEGADLANWFRGKPAETKVTLHAHLTLEPSPTVALAPQVERVAGSPPGLHASAFHPSSIRSRQHRSSGRG